MFISTLKTAVLAAAVAGNMVDAVGPFQGTQCTPAAYGGTVCPSTIMTYQVAIPRGGQPAADQLLNSTASALGGIRALDPTCYNSLLALACGATFPACINGVAQMPCQTSCMSAMKVCTKAFSSINLLPLLQQTLQNCTGAVSNLDSELYPTANCYNPPLIPAASTSTTPTTPTTPTIPAACPAFFLPAKNTTDFATSPNCDAGTGCCVPCPVVDYFYPVGTFERILGTAQILNLFSTIFMTYIVLSWVVLPGRRGHPSDIILHFCTALLVWNASTLIEWGNHRRVQCADEVTPASYKNNPYCAAQGVILTFSIHLTVFWCGVMIMNLYATIVRRSDIFQRYKIIVTAFCYSLAALFTGLAFYAADVDNTTGLVCIITPSKANSFFFSVQAVFVIPAAFANVVTLYTIIKVTRKTNSNGMSSSTTSAANHNIGNSGNSGANSGSGSTYPPHTNYPTAPATTVTNGHAPPTNSTYNQSPGYPASTKSLTRKSHDVEVAENFQPNRPATNRKQIIALIKVNWRAVILGITFMANYIIYFFFFNLSAVRIANTTPATPWVREWSVCIITENAANPDLNAVQNICSERFASNMPSQVLTWFTIIIVATPGISAGLIFGTSMQVIRDWITLFRGERY